MMKKLLILMLVLGLASTASAALTLQIATDPSVSSDYSEEGSEYTLGVCENIWIGIYNDTQGQAGDPRQFGAYVGFDETTAGEWYEGETPNSAIYDPPVPFTPTEGNIYYGVTFGFDVWYSSIKVADAEKFVGVGVTSGFEFHCLDEVDVVITLLDEDYTTVLDTITIHQIPEPATIALLGLGGLFLRWRRK